MVVDVKFRVLREGKTVQYPYETVVQQYSIDGKEWFNVCGTPFEKIFPYEENDA